MILSASELIAIAISRELQDNTVVLTGAASAITLAASMLAKARSAPSLTILGAGVYINPRRLVPEFTAGWNCRPEAIGDMSDVFAITELGIDVMFYGGMQIDRFGSVNLHRVSTPKGSLRGPGLANTALGHTARRTILYTTRHDTRTLVDEVEYTSVVGHRRRGQTRQDLLLANDGPAALFTPLAVFRPDQTGELRATARLSEINWGDVGGLTGWRLIDPEPVLFVPTADEVATLRDLVDPDGLLRTG